MVVGQFGLSVPDFLDGFDGTDRGGRRPAHLRPVRVRRRDQPRQRLADRAADLPRGPGRGLGVDVRAHVRRRRQDPVARCPPTRARSTRRAWSSRPSSSTRRACSTRTRCGSSSTRCAMPDWNRADLNGLVAACRTAARRVVEMCERFGTGTYLSALDALLQRNYDAMKVLLAMVFEEGQTLSFTDYICDDGVGNGPYELKLSLTRTGEKVHLDFTGSSPQAAGPDQLLHQREPGPDVLRHLHDHRGRPADPLERRLLPAGRRHDPGRLVLEAEAPGGAQRRATTASGGCSTCSAGCSGRPTRRCSTRRASRRRRTSCTPATTRRATGRASGSSSTRSASAASPAARSATGRTGTRCGRASSTSRASTWSPTTRCASRSGRPSPTPAAPACTAAATASTWRTCSRSRARSRSTTTAG